MSKLDSFKNLGLGWDHNFYKAVIGASVKEKLENDGVEQTEIEAHAKSVMSI